MARKTLRPDNTSHNDRPIALVAKRRGLSPKLVLFDLGKVILDFEHHWISERLAKISGLPVNTVHTAIFKTPDEIALEKGRITPKVFFTKLKDKLKLKLSYQEFVPLWNDIFWPKPGMSALVAELRRKRRPLAMLSNTNKLHFDFVKNKYPVIRNFDRYFLSYKLCLRKPDKKLYESVMKRTGFKPREIVYFDDVPGFVRAASKIGYKAHLMESSQKCRKILKGYGLI